MNMGHKRGGRKRKAVKREPNGKPSRRVADKQANRSIDEQSAMQVAKEARQRVFGVREADTGTELAGTVCGRLLLRGEISQAQMDAAKAFQETYAAYQRVMDSPRQPKAVQIGEATGRGALWEPSPEAATKAKEQWDKAKRVLSDANSIHRTATLYAACDYLVLRDQDLRNLIGDLRIALNALSRHYGLVAKAA